MTQPPRRAPGTGSVRHLGGDRYLLRITTADTKRRTKTIRAVDADAAQKVLDDLVAVLTQEGQAAVGGLTLRAWLGEWLRRQERSRSHLTYSSRVENYLYTAPFADDLLVNIKPADVRGLMRSLIAKLEPSTASSALTVLRMALREAVDDELLASNPAAEVRLPKSARKSKSIRQPLTRDELETIRVSTLPLVDRAIILTGAIAGLRSGELHAMPLDHVHRRDGLLLLHVEFGGYGGATTKSGEGRWAPVLGPARLVLEEWLATVPRGGERNPERLLFPGARGGRRVLTHASNWLRYRLRLVGIKRQLRFHDLRHSAATALQNGWLGTSLATEHVQAILGHATIAQTEAYTGGAFEAMLVAARELDAKDQWRIAPEGWQHGTAANQAKNETTARRRPCSHGNRGTAGGLVSDDPKPILQVDLLAATEDLVVACATGRATDQDVSAWLELLLEHEPDPWRQARALLGQPGRHFVRQALELARQVLAMRVPVERKAGG